MKTSSLRGIVAFSLVLFAVSLGLAGCASDASKADDTQDEDLTGGCLSAGSGAVPSQTTCDDLGEGKANDANGRPIVRFDIQDTNDCRGVIEYMRPAAAANIQKCWVKARTGSETATSRQIRDTRDLDFDGMGACVNQVIQRTCYGSSSQEACQRIISRWNSSVRTAPNLQECQRAMSAFKPEHRANYEACVVRESGRARQGALFACAYPLRVAHD